MKIAMIHTPLTGTAGGERQILRLAIELQKIGHEVEIFTNYADPEKCYPELIKEVRVSEVPSSLPLWLITGIASRSGLSQSIGRLRRLSIGRALRDGNDIINCHNLSSNWAAYIAKKRLGIPVVWMCNEPPFWYFNPDFRRKRHFLIEFPFYHLFDKQTVKYVDEIVVLDEATKRRVKEIYGRDSIMIRSGIDVEHFQKGNGQSVRKEYGLENDFLMLQVGGSSIFKRHFDSIKALYHLSGNYRNIKLILVGHGLKQKYEPLVTDLNLSEKVLFFSNLDDDTLANFYAACNVFLFPADQSWGLAVTEAMAAGKPVIVSKKAGASRIIDNNVNGFVVDHGDSRKIAEQVEKLINNPELALKVGRNAYNYIKGNLSWGEYAKNMEKIFKRAIERQPSSHR